ncbi:hypothetical protein V5799_004629 [Amblyomma americanum]|uniref:M13 family peptidase n=1 Tax=Amblyomma americanum TaxID=6943 RepID=A0AAQ4D5K1_AMBAM
MEGQSEDAVVPKASEYYKSCVKPREVTATELHTFMRFKQDLGLMWPEKKQVAQDALFVLIKMSISWGIHLLFNLRALPAYKGRPQTLYLRRGILNAKWLGKNWTHGRFVTDVANHCGILGVAVPTDGYEELRQTVEDIIKSALAIPPDATSDTQFKLKEMELLMPNSTQHWLAYLNDLHKPQFRWDLNSPVALEDDAILTAIDALQKTYAAKNELLMMGFSYVFVRSYLWVLGGKPELLYGSDANLGRHMLKVTCLEFTTSHFGLLVAAKHIHERYSVDTREGLNQFYHTIQSETKALLSEAQWVGSMTRTQAFIKLDELTLNAMPDEDFFSKINLARLYRDFPATSGSFVNNFIDVAAAYRLLIGHDHFIGIYSKRLGGGSPNRYNYYYNIAYLSLGALEPPILYTDGTLAMKYGSLGTVIAECAVRTFDRRGVQVDEKGRTEHWWDTPAYAERTSCDLLAGVATGTGSPDRKPAGRDPREILHSALFPLAPALTTSFYAYRRAVVTLQEDNKVDQLRLRGMDELTDDQVFFLTYCLMTCGTSKTSGDACNVPLRHMPEFATAFSCPEGSSMNPVKKCTFFT